MKDWLFYPLALTVIIAMIAFAFTRGQAAYVSTGSTFVVERQDLNTLYAAEGVSFSIAGDAENPNAYAVLSAHVAKDIAPPSAGVFVTLPPAYKEMYTGKPLRISIVARKGRASKLESFEVGYLSTDAGATGWLPFEVTSEFQTFDFEFTPRVPQAPGGNDYVGIWPDVDGEGRTLDVQKIQIEVVDDANTLD